MIRWRERALSAGGVYVVFVAGYGLANRYVPAAAGADLATALDRATPLVPEMVVPFYFAYLLVLAPALLVSARPLLWRATAAFGLLVAVSTALFFLFPVTVARPSPAEIPPGWAGKLLAAIYRHDRPVCGFPSLHVSASLLAALVVLRERRRVGAALLVLAALTAAATLFIKQHVLWDVAGGVGLALAINVAVVGRAGAGGEVAPAGGVRSRR